MVWAIVALVFSVQTLDTLGYFENTQVSYRHSIDTWGITWVDQVGKVKGKFQESRSVSCNNIYKTSEVPSTAIILYRNSGRLLCMGSIVDARHILSAKKCFEKADNTDLLVLVGCYKAYWGKNSQVVKVQKIVRNDYVIALLRLESDLTFTDYVKPTRLPRAFTKYSDFDKLWKPPFNVIGFPIDRYEVPGELIDKKKVYTMEEEAEEALGKCKQNYTRLHLEDRKLFCVKGVGTYCWGGLGGAVLKKLPNKYFLQVGLVVAENCTEGGTSPYLCARTDVFGDWIRGNTWHGQQAQ